MEKEINNKENKQLRPPYASSGQADLALDIFRRLVPKKIDLDFIVNNGLATKTNAFRIMDFYKWLGIIDENGNIIESVAEKLRLIGEEKEKFIQELIKKGYKTLFDSVNILEAKKDDLLNFFISNNGFTQIQSKFATALFIHLCQKHGIPISEEIKKKSYLLDKPKKDKKLKSNMTDNRKVFSSAKQQPPIDNIPEGKIMILVRSNDLSINKPFFAESASQLQDIYDNELKRTIRGAKLMFFGEEEDGK